MVAETPIYATEAWKSGVEIAATFGLIFGWTAYGILGEAGPASERYLMYVAVSALLPVTFGGLHIAVAVSGLGPASLDAAVAYTAGLAAWNIVQYYLFPAAIFVTIKLLLKVFDGALIVHDWYRAQGS